MKKKSSLANGASLAEAIRSARGSRRRWPWIAGGLLLVVVVVAFAMGHRKGGPGEMSFRTSTLERGELSVTVTATGNLEPTNQVTVGSELSGTVLEIYVDENDRVTKGQALLRLDTTTLETELNALRASLQAAEARVTQAELTAKQANDELARQQKLRESSGGRLPSVSEMQSVTTSAENADADLISARASLAQSQAQVESQESNLAKALISSPTNGVVLTRSIEVGQTVAASFSAPELFVIAEDLSHMQLEVAVAEADIARITEGLGASFAVDAYPDRKYEASVTRVSWGSEIVDNVVTYAVKLIVDNGDFSLRPGMTATADLRVAECSDAWLVPPAALRFEMPKPEDGAGGPPPNMGSAPSQSSSSQKRSFVDNLMPRPPRPNRRSSTTTEATEPATNSDGDANTIWILRDGHPMPVHVAVGLSDGRRTQVESEELQEGDEVIVGQSQVNS